MSIVIGRWLFSRSFTGIWASLCTLGRAMNGGSPSWRHVRWEAHDISNAAARRLLFVQALSGTMLYLLWLRSNSRMAPERRIAFACSLLDHIQAAKERSHRIRVAGKRGVLILGNYPIDIRTIK